jgi:hypothetical protein
MGDIMLEGQVRVPDAGAILIPAQKLNNTPVSKVRLAGSSLAPVNAFVFCQTLPQYMSLHPTPTKFSVCNRNGERRQAPSGNIRHGLGNIRRG